MTDGVKTENMKIVLIVAKCNVNVAGSGTTLRAAKGINSSKV